MIKPSRVVTLAALLFASLPLTASAGTLTVTPDAAAIGNFGLDVALGECASPDEVLVESPAQIEGAFEACTTLTATNVEVTGTGASFVAGREIILKDGFSVGAGVEFTAGIEPAIYRFVPLANRSPSAETSYRASFRLRLDDLTIGEGDRLRHFAGYSAGGGDEFWLTLERVGGLNRLLVTAREDDGGAIETAQGVVVPTGWNLVELDWSATDGHFLISVNGDAPSGLSSLDNDLGRIDLVEWGLIGGVASASSGSLQVDQFYSSD